MFNIDWAAMFIPAQGLAEIVLRGTIMYLALFTILRFVGRRQTGHFGPADLLVIVLIADAAQNALGSEYKSVTEGIVLILTIVVWEYALDWMAFRFPGLRPLLKAPPLNLVQDGRVIRKNLRLEMLTSEDLMSQLREEGVEDLAEVKLARLEGDGRLSVISLGRRSAWLRSTSIADRSDDPRAPRLNSGRASHPENSPSATRRGT
jgi:uncharacterized membrane protein YcaP (DUF421 family)